MKLNIIPTIISQHAEEAAFIWLLRSGACSEPDYNLMDLAKLDERLEANIDGLRIAGEPGWDICKDALAIQEPGEIFAAGVLAFESNDPDRMDTMLSVVEADRELQRALISALGWISFDTIANPVHRLLEADFPFLRYIGLAAHAVHRQDPGIGLADLIKDTDEIVRARGLKAAGELKRLDIRDSIREHYGDDDEACRFYAAWSGAQLNDPNAFELLVGFVEKKNVFAKQALDTAIRGMNLNAAHGWLKDLARQPDLLELAIQGYGALGTSAVIPELLQWMKIDALARKAGEAFSMITGVDFENEDFATDAPEGFKSGPTEDPDDEDVDLDPDEDLPWPDTELVAAWWHKRKSTFQAGTRYLAGNSISTENCMQVLLNGYQRQRMAASQELSFLHPGQPFFEVRAPGSRQLRLLSSEM